MELTKRWTCLRQVAVSFVILAEIACAVTIEIWVYVGMAVRGDG